MEVILFMDERRKIKYLEQLAFIKNVKPCYNPVLLALLEKTEETAGGLSFTVNKKYKQDIANKLGTSLSMVNNAISVFYKAGYFIRSNRGNYYFTRELFGMKRWDTLDNIISVCNYGEDSVKTVFLFGGETT